MDENFEQELEDLMREAEEEQNSGQTEDTRKDEESQDEELGEEHESEEKVKAPTENSSAEESIDEPGDKSDDKSEEPFTTLEVNGQKMNIDSLEELTKIAQQGAMALANRKDTPEEQLYIQQNNISKDDLALLKDIKSGNTEALKKIMVDMKVDPLDLETDEVNYNPNFEVTPTTRMDRLVNDIKSDSTLMDTMQTTFDKLPETFVDRVTSDPDALEGFVRATRDGVIQDVLPQAMKQSFATGRDLFDTLPQVLYDAYKAKNSSTQERQSPAERQRVDALKQKIVTTKKVQRSDKESSSPEDVWNMSEEDFDKFVDTLKPE